MLKIFGNGTDGVSWTSEPTKRGTFSILSSCLVTIILCVWTALHLNIPRHSDERRSWIRKRSLWNKVCWLIFALVAPELVAYTAFHQRSEALKLMKAFKKIKKELEKKGQGQEKNIPTLSIEQAFYAIMGGYQIHIPSDDSPFLKHQTHFSLESGTLQDLAATYPHILKIASDLEIKDKSKANHVAKSLVCVQAGWFILQCVTRMALSLPITLLELNTFGHSLCALLVYFFWWNKPLDVQQPMQITGPEAKKYAAYMWLISPRNGTGFHVQSLTPMDLRQRSTELRKLIKKKEIGHEIIEALFNVGLLSRQGYKSMSELEARVSENQDVWREECPVDEEVRVNSTGVPIQALDTDPDISNIYPEAGSTTAERRELRRKRFERIADFERQGSKQEYLVNGLYFSADTYEHTVSLVDLMSIVALAADMVKEKLDWDRVIYLKPSYTQPIVDRLNDLPRS